MTMLKYASKLTFGASKTDLREDINFTRMREQRAARMKQVLKREGIPAVLVTHEPNVRYMTGFSWSEFMTHLSYAIFFAEGDPIIFAHAGSYQQMPDQVPWIKEWRIARSWLAEVAGPEATREEVGLFAKEIRDELQKRGLAKEKLGIIGFDYLAREGLKGAGLNLVEAWTLLLEASKIKTADEINCFKMTASIMSTGWQRIREACKVGVTVAGLRRTVVDAMTDAGSEQARCNIQSGPLSFERGVTYLDRRIEHGDVLHVPLCGTRYLGYPSCGYRTFVVGREPSAKEKEWYQRVKDSVYAAIEATKPGKTTADAAKAFPPASKWGYKSEVEVLTVEFGHGLGMPVSYPVHVPYALPNINRQWSINHPQPFEKGMIIAYESLEGEHRVAGVRLEHMVVVTDDGAEILDHYPGEEIITVG
jgi:Xaa-Pro aminopeptidase